VEARAVDIPSPPVPAPTSTPVPTPHPTPAPTTPPAPKPAPGPTASAAPADDDEADEDGEAPELPEGPEAVATPRGVEVKQGDETIVHKRGTLRARLATQAMEATPIKLAASATRDRRPKKETGEKRKTREALLGVRATFNGLTKNHKGSLRYNVLLFVQSKANREIPGWPKGTVLPTEIDAHFQQVCKPYIHKLIEDQHFERTVPLVPELPKFNHAAMREREAESATA
jgi:antitoxin (DNA-binding transcriptional repressor) of toxin-antitoxin stability system